jgi:hypothetical protein
VRPNLQSWVIVAIRRSSAFPKISTRLKGGVMRISVKGFDVPYNYGHPIQRQPLSRFWLLKLAGL